jgi:hypothetical protein
MFKGTGRQIVNRKAVAAAHGYARGIHPEKDQGCEIIYSDDSIALQVRVISGYVE